MLSTSFRCSFLVVGLALVACSGSEPAPAGGGGAAGMAIGGGAGTAAGMAGAAGSAAGGAAGSASGGGGASGGQAQAGGGAGGGGGGGAGGAGGAGGMAGAGGVAPFVLTSPAFEHVESCTNANRDTCDLFPEANVMESIGGMNQSPELNWGPGPAGTMSYAVCEHDLTNDFTHWCIWNIPAATLQLPANLGRQKMPPTPAGSEQDSFSGEDDGYMGSGQAGNVYDFKLYALNVADYEPDDAQDRQGIYDDLEGNDDLVLGSSLLRARSDPEGYD